MGVVDMDPAEAVQAHLDLEARQSVAMHYGTFRLTAEGIDDPVKALASALHERGVAPDRFVASTSAPHCGSGNVN